MKSIEDLCAADPLLRKEIDSLSDDQRAQVVAELRLRGRATELAAELRLDYGDVYHQLKQLARSPTERLRMGLCHGRRRRQP